MSRIPYADLAGKPEQVRAMCESHPLNLTRMMANATPTVFLSFNRFASTLYLDSLLPADLREVAILRVGYLSKSLYETEHHEAIARSIGINDGQIAAIRFADRESALLNDAQRAVMAFADEVIINVQVTDATLDLVRQHLGDEQVMDLMLVIGVYMTVGRIAETTGIPIDAQLIDSQSLQDTLKVASAG